MGPKFGLPGSRLYLSPSRPGFKTTINADTRTHTHAHTHTEVAKGLTFLAPTLFVPWFSLVSFTPARSHLGKYALAKLCLTGRSSAARLTQNQSEKVGEKSLKNVRGRTYYISDCPAQL